MSRAIAQGSVYAIPFTERVRRRRRMGDPASRTGPEALSAREKEVIDTWIRVGANKLVAAELGITEQTVKNYVTSIIRKMEAAGMGQAAIRYDRSRKPRERRSGAERRSGLDRRRAVSGG
jgi:DNA-binding NarL/FixJ family response regulator